MGCYSNSVDDDLIKLLMPGIKGSTYRQTSPLSLVNTLGIGIFVHSIEVFTNGCFTVFVFCKF